MLQNLLVVLGTSSGIPYRIFGDDDHASIHLYIETCVHIMDSRLGEETRENVDFASFFSVLEVKSYI